MKLLTLFALLVVAVVTSGSCADAAIVYSESVSGDLSGAFSSPTAVVLGDGGNTFVGQIGNNGNTGATDGSDADYFTFTLGANQTVDAITVDSFTSPGFPNVSFLGYVAASAFAGQGGGNIDNSAFVNASSGDILVDLAGGPLTEGDHAFWFQETTSTTVDYQLTFNVVTAVPEPSSFAALVGLGVVGIGVVRARRRRDRKSRDSHQR